MRYTIYIILMIITFGLAHLKNARLLIDAEHNAGNMGEYIGGVFLAPLLVQAIIYGVAIMFSKTKKVNFFRCSNWVLGVMLLGNVFSFVNYSLPRHLTLPGAQITVTVPNRGWKIQELKQTKMLVSGNIHIIAERHSQDELGIHALTDIEQYSRHIFGEKYDKDIYQVYQCKAQNFQCGLQNVAIQLKNQTETQVLYVYLLDKTSVIQLTAIINEDNFAKDYETFKEILNSVTDAAL
ncbi:hypothetical protein [Superficieibacter sp. 1612_C1]|uniref:hypothetical protein n=1 Tax=Superficieibacter sp. 1612_C1 TaxID=2780382 RepID=UPI001884660C|nr:hypothetical protein [Superficieibacter sp. 1612_C1]